MKFRVQLVGAVVAVVLFFTLFPIVPFVHSSPMIPEDIPPFAFRGSLSLALFGTGIGVNGLGEWHFEVNVCTPTNIFCNPHLPFGF